ncbi:MAG: signal protein [Myxococcaceae bacterium]|nr:signal protein [Myxococcaceae bacterium]MCI0670544.1 signal protein [Myxococcaceae bacterium]
MATPVTTRPSATGAPSIPRRRLRNYLLDARIQLKFTAYMVGVTIGIALLLGTFLFRNTQALLTETQEAVEARSVAAEASRELTRAILTNQLLQRMEDPAFARQLEEESRSIDARYERERLAVVTARSDLVRRQKLTWLALAGALVSFIVVIALATIVITHRVVGPIYRIRRLVHAVGDGELHASTHQLREADELKDLFADVTRMVHSLRTLQQEDLDAMTRALRHARAQDANAELVQQLEALTKRFQNRLGKSES